MIKKFFTFVVLFFFISSSVAFSHSPAVAGEEESLRYVLKDAMYGGGIGMLMGGASILLFYSKDMGNHLDIFAMGAGAGIISGTIYGVVKTATTGFANLEKGNFYVGLPSPKVNVTKVQGQKNVTTLSGTLFQYRY